jgi:molybdate-binding protein/DNA-binding transcriptional regulator YhcF (GntR family)
MRRTETFLYQEIAESLRRRIASGELEPGGKLPPVRKMAKRWNCTPGTVSRAYSQLAQEGLVEGYRGGGTRVTASSLHPQRPALGWATLVNRAESYLLEALSSGHTSSQAQSALSVAIARWQELQNAASPAPETPDLKPEQEVRFAGSHDLTVELLARMLLEKQPQTQLTVEIIGSLGGLMALARDEADIAGSHLWDEKTDDYNIPFVRRLLPGRRVALVTLVQRSLGLIVAPGNPLDISTLNDLIRPNVHIVNRQPGSGTRVWLDAQLKALNIASDEIEGYNQEELTHLAVARAVEQGKVSVGLGIHAAASAYGLDFVPLTKERYELVLPEEVLGSAPVERLLATVRSQQFQESVVTLGGYDTSETGQKRWVS